MNTFLLVAILCMGLYAVYLLHRSLRPSDGEADRLRENIEGLRKEIQETRVKDREYLQETMQGQFRQSAVIIREVTEKLTALDATNKQVLTFSGQLEELGNILKQPKGKGLLSEYWLGALLGHVLSPTQYKMQYKFCDGEVVDAVVFFQEKIIPIDAKFSSEKYVACLREGDDAKRAQLQRAFKQDLKARIDETAKYIRPGEGTTDFAFMFLPAEGIFYDLLVQEVGALEINRTNLMEYSFSRRVLIVSPATFFAYLQTVLLGLKEAQMAASVREILARVEQLGRHLGSYETYLQKLGSNLGTTVNMYNQAYKEFQKVDKDVYKLSEGKVGGHVDPVLLDKPNAELDALDRPPSTIEIKRSKLMANRV